MSTERDERPVVDRDPVQTRRISYAVNMIEVLLLRMHPDDRAIALEVIAERWDFATGARRGAFTVAKAKADAARVDQFRRHGVVTEPVASSSSDPDAFEVK